MFFFHSSASMMRIKHSNQNAAVRLVKLPVVRSAFALVSVFYSDTKCRNSCIKSLCEVVENGVKTITSVAYDRAAPIFVQLEPQITIVNDLACKSLDKLENAFPVLHQPTEQIAASAKSMMLEAKDMMSIAANGTMDCVLYTVTWVVDRMHVEADPTGNMVDDEALNMSPLKRAIGLASEGLDSALNVSEALVDQVLSPTNAEMEEEVKAVEGFEVTTVGSSYSVRLVSLTVKLCRRAYHQAEEKMHSVKINFNCITFQDNFPRVGVQLYAALIYLALNTPFNWLVGPLFPSEPSVLPQATPPNGQMRKRPAKKPICNRGRYANYEY